MATYVVRIQCVDGPPADYETPDRLDAIETAVRLFKHNEWPTIYVEAESGARRRDRAATSAAMARAI